MDFEIGVGCIRLPREQRLDLVVVRLGGQRSEAGDRLIAQRAVPFRIRHFQQLDRIELVFLDRAGGGDGGVEPGALAHYLLRLFLVVPQARIFDARVQLIEPAQRAVPIEEAAQQVQRGIDTVTIGLRFGAHEKSPV